MLLLIDQKVNIGLNLEVRIKIAYSVISHCKNDFLNNLL